MRSNQTKAIMRRRAAFGAWATMADPAVVEMIGHAGYDFTVIDMEHVANDFQTTEHMIRAADAVGITSIVRVPENNPKVILRVLDCGAQGVMVPHVMSAADARLAVAACRYPPAGERGISPTGRAARYGFDDFDAHARRSDEEVLVVAMIEDRQAVEEIDAIVSTPGLDVAMIAPYDLAGSLGLPFSPNHPDIVQACQRVAAAARRAGMTLGIPADHRMYTRSLAQVVEDGCRFVLTAFDFALLGRALREDAARLAPFRAEEASS